MGIVKQLALLTVVSQGITKEEYDTLLKQMDVILKNVNKKEEERTRGVYYDGGAESRQRLARGDVSLSSGTLQF